MNLQENITVKEEGPHTPETIVTGKPQLTSVNAVFLTDGYNVLASATAMEQAGGHENNKTVEDKSLHTAQEPHAPPEPATDSKRQEREGEQGLWEMAIQETGPHYPEELAL